MLIAKQAHLRVETTCLSFSSQTLRKWLPGTDVLQTSGSASHSRLATVVICVALAVTAIGIRLLLWQDNRPNFARIFTGMLFYHQQNARVLAEGNLKEFITGPAPPGDANILTYPPGYPIIMATVSRVFGERDAWLRLLQIACDALGGIILFFLVAQFLPRGAALIAGGLAALSPQLGYYSLLLLPDSLATLPILLALYFLALAAKLPRLRTVIAAGVCVGLSCWLRANALLLAPFLGLGLWLLLRQKRSGERTTRQIWVYPVVLVAIAFLVISPITLRNLIVFHRLVPLSLGAGQMLNVGIGDYDPQRRFGLPGTDLETVTEEARRYGRPDYASSLFGGNGIDRDQDRVSRALAVIKAHPLWFSSIVAKRGLSMFKLERVRPVMTQPAPTHSLNPGTQATPMRSLTPAELMLETSSWDTATFSLAADKNSAKITTTTTQPGLNSRSVVFGVEKNADYIFRIPIKVDQGNVVIKVKDGGGNILASSTVLRPLENSPIISRGLSTVGVPFVSDGSQNVVLEFANEGNRPVATVFEIGTIELFNLGPSSFTWIRYPRAIIHLAQTFFLSAWILPLAFAGVVLLLAAGQKRFLLILALVPLYYICTQSMLHTEYRYVMAIQYCLFACVAATLYWAARNGFRLIERAVRSR